MLEEYSKVNSFIYCVQDISSVFIHSSCEYHMILFFPIYFYGLHWIGVSGFLKENLEKYLSADTKNYIQMIMDELLLSFFSVTGWI